MSRNTKKELMWYQPIGDTEAMAGHLEKMEAKGWRLERADNWWLHYRRGEPAQVHYAVAFFPDATIFDAKPVEGQETYYDYCRAAGWEYVCSYGSTQYFRNPRPGPVPIETDEAQKLKALSRVMLRTLVLENGLWLLLGLMWFFNFRNSFRWNPLSSLSRYGFPAAILMTLLFIAAGLLGLAWVGGWYLWSRWSVKRGGPCGRISGRLRATGDGVLLVIALAAVAGMLLDQPGSWAYMAFELAGYSLLAVGARFVLKWLKTRELSNTGVLGRLVVYAVIGAIALVAVTGKFGDYLREHTPPEREPAAVYTDSDGRPYEIYRDELPLTLEDLGYEVTPEDWCSYEHQKSSETPWTSYECYYQTPCGDYSNLPYLDYKFADIHWDWLRELCWNTILKGPKYSGRQLEGYTPIDPAPWGADAAARRNSTQALLYGERIVLVYTSWIPSYRESTIIGEKLGVQQNY